MKKLAVEKFPFLGIEWMYDFTVDGTTYASAVHYFLAHKYTTDDLIFRIATAPTVSLAKFYSESFCVNGDLRARTGELVTSEWHDKKVAIMINGMRAKFSGEIPRKMLMDACGDKCEFTSRANPWLARMLNVVVAEIDVDLY